jgi:hypothetical protein
LHDGELCFLISILKIDKKVEEKEVGENKIWKDIKFRLKLNETYKNQQKVRR